MNRYVTFRGAEGGRVQATSLESWGGRKYPSLQWHSTEPAYNAWLCGGHIKHGPSPDVC